MQLVRIRHERCNEYDGVETLVLAPSEWSEDEINSHIFKAQDAYLEDVQRLMQIEKEEAPAHYWNFQQFIEKADLRPNMTLVEARKLFEEYQAKSKAFKEKLNARHKRFDVYLTAEGFVTIWSDEAEQHITTADVNWGHRHGWPLQYGDHDRYDFPSVGGLVKAALKHDQDVYS